MILYDMHTHSTSSDGTLTPSELVRKAHESSVSVVALTDHDTVSGCSEAEHEASVCGISFIPGTEISAAENNKLHILGFGLDCSDRELVSTLDYLADERKKAAVKVCSALEKFGVYADIDEVLECAGNGSVGKPHIAEIMMKKGYVSSIAEAFDRYLNQPEIKNLKKEKLPAKDAVNLIHHAGGLAVMAHPYQLKMEREELHSFIRELAELGIDGIECWYSRYTPEMVYDYTQLALELGLYTSIGSDFHGSRKPGIFIGTGADNSLLKLREIKEFDGRILRKLQVLQ